MKVSVTIRNKVASQRLFLLRTIDTGNPESLKRLNDTSRIDVAVGAVQAELREEELHAVLLPIFNIPDREDGDELIQLVVRDGHDTR